MPIDKLTENPGSCLAECVSFILKVGLEDDTFEDIPRPTWDEVENFDDPVIATLTDSYLRRLATWLRNRGWALLSITPPVSKYLPLPYLCDEDGDLPVLCIAGGPRISDRLGHSVVWEGVPGLDNSRVVFNCGEDLLAVEDLTFLVPMPTSYFRT